MKVNLDANATENKGLFQSFGGGAEYERKGDVVSSEQLLSQDVRDLLKNYDNRGQYEEYNVSGYAIDSTYKRNYKVDNPIIIFNEDAYRQV